MERREGKKAESANSNNWQELFHLFAKAIASEDDTRKIWAMIKLAKMSKAAPESVLGLTVPMLLDLLESPCQNPSSRVHEFSASCLKTIASRDELADLMGQFGTIPVVLGLLPNSEEGLRRALLKCLRNLVTFCVPNRIIVANQGGVEIIVDMLVSTSGESKLILLEILSGLALVREVRKFLWNSRRVELLVEAAREKVAGAVAQFSLNEADRAVLADYGAIQRLINMLDDESDEVRDNAAEALVNFSSDPLLEGQISCILENPIFQNMRSIVMQMRAADEHMDMSLPS